MQGSLPHPRSQSGRLPELRSPRLNDGLDDLTPRSHRDRLRDFYAYPSDDEEENARPAPSQSSSVAPTQPLTPRSSDSVSTVVDLSQDSDSEELPLTQPRLVRRNAEVRQDPPAAAQVVAAAPPAAVADEPEIGEQPEQKAFQWASKKGHGTWKGHLNFAQFHAWFVASFGELVAYSFVHENGDSAAHYAHTHFAFCLKKKPNTKNSRVFDFDGVHPHLKSIQNETQWKNTVNYHKKAPVFLKQEGCDNVSDNPLQAALLAIDSASSWKQVVLNDEVAPQIAGRLSWAKERYYASRKPGRDRWDPEEVLEYQKSLMWLVDLDWDRPDKLALTDGGKVKKLTHWKDRLVHWTYSPHGGVGKSVTAMHIAMTKQYCYLSATEKVGDLIHAFVSGDFKGVVLDLSRAVSAESKEFIKTLEVIETFKNGAFLSPKYQSLSVTGADIPVFVFANIPPDMSGIYISKDRVEFTTYLVDEDGNCQYLYDLCERISNAILNE